jgi:hypothetical protein
MRGYYGPEKDNFWHVLYANQLYALETSVEALDALAKALRPRAPGEELPDYLASAQTLEALASAEGAASQEEISAGRVAPVDTQSLNKASFIIGAHARTLAMKGVTISDTAPALPKGFAQLGSFVQTLVTAVPQAVAKETTQVLKRGMEGRGLIGLTDLNYLMGSSALYWALQALRIANPLSTTLFLVPLAYNVVTQVPELLKGVIPACSAAVGGMHIHAKRRASGQLLDRNLEEEPEEAWKAYVTVAVGVLKKEIRLLDSLSREGRFQKDVESAYSHVLTSFLEVREQSVQVITGLRYMSTPKMRKIDLDAAATSKLIDNLMRDAKKTAASEETALMALAPPLTSSPASSTLLAERMAQMRHRAEVQQKEIEKLIGTLRELHREKAIAEQVYRRYVRESMKHQRHGFRSLF